MRISTEKLEALKKRARGGYKRGAAIANNAKPSAVAAVAGAIAAEAARYGEEKVDALKEHWWASGAVVMVAGHFVRRKSQAAGLGLVGAGAALLARGYRENEAAEAKTTTPAPVAKPLTAAEAGAFGMNRAAALLAARNVYRPQVQARRAPGFAPVNVNANRKRAALAL